ncbi:MAG: glycosyltransferase family 39 protein, partial [Acidimicrobiales bacterium]
MQAERLTTTAVTTTLAPRARAHRRPAHRGPATRSARPIAGVLIGLAVAVAAGLGLVLRAQLLTHQALSGDEAVAGLMAEQIRHGHLYTFYWGNQYGGGEIYVVALLFAIFGASAVVLNGTATVVTAGAALLLWRSARRLGPGTPGMGKWPAVAAAAAFWVWPEAAVWNSTRQFGFRELTAAAGIGAILFTLRLLDGWSTRDAAAVGLLLGLGWWSSPEFVYFGVAVGAAVGIAACRRVTRPHFSHLLVMVATFVVGALPWWWTNLHT